MAEKTGPGNFFEDFHVGQSIVHAIPRTVTEGEVSLYTALYGSRFAVNSSSEFAASIGFSRTPADDLLTFHLVFGKTVPDISLNAIANLGYASGVFGTPLYPGDAISASSTVIGLKQNTDGKTGVVYVRSEGVNQRGEMVIDYCRWVMVVRKKDLSATAPEAVIPDLSKSWPSMVAATWRPPSPATPCTPGRKFSTKYHSRPEPVLVHCESAQWQPRIAHVMISLTKARIPSTTIWSFWTSTTLCFRPHGSVLSCGVLIALCERQRQILSGTDH
jgi:acyl dehydratase